MPKLSLAKLERHLYSAADRLRQEGLDAATLVVGNATGQSGRGAGRAAGPETRCPDPRGGQAMLPLVWGFFCGAAEVNPVVWVASSRDDLKAFPEEVQNAVGCALWFAQTGTKHPHAKPLRGYGSAGVVEIIEDADGNTYRAVYTVKFAEFVYVRHCFQKESKQRAKTPRTDVALITLGSQQAERDYRATKAAR